MQYNILLILLVRKVVFSIINTFSISTTKKECNLFFQQSSFFLRSNCLKVNILNDIIIMNADAVFRFWAEKVFLYSDDFFDVLVISLKFALDAVI
jgi:hypothetical protein